MALLVGEMVVHRQVLHLPQGYCQLMTPGFLRTMVRCFQTTPFSIVPVLLYIQGLTPDFCEPSGQDPGHRQHPKLCLFADLHDLFV